jgi:hypothetical protein
LFYTDTYHPYKTNGVLKVNRPNEETGFPKDRRLRADGFIIRAQATIRTDGFFVRAGFAR